MLKYKLIHTGVLPTNTYVLFGDQSKNCVVIDPSFDGGKLLGFLLENKLNLKGILLTHGHFDHCGGVNTLINKFKVPVFGSSFDSEIAANASKNRWRARAEDCTITDFIDSKDSFDVDGFTFKVLNTPGHTDGSVCYFIDGLMLSGDTLFCGCVGRTDLPGGDSMKMRNSLSKIYQLQEDYTVLPGHEAMTTLSAEKETNPYLKDEVNIYD
jgi:hydroxyacylglutathione hydrolase